MEAIFKKYKNQKLREINGVLVICDMEIEKDPVTSIKKTIEQFSENYETERCSKYTYIVLQNLWKSQTFLLGCG